MTRMFIQRKDNIAGPRGCKFKCIYCAFEKSYWRSSCEKCRAFEPHFHPESMQRRPPRTPGDEFVTIGFTGDVCFLDIEKGELLAVLDYTCKYPDRTFFLQSKNPAWFLNFERPENLILGTTIETNRSRDINVEDGISYSQISKAPPPVERYKAMKKVGRRMIVVVEPILNFDMAVLFDWLQQLDPVVYIGYDSHPEKNHLPEPSLSKTLELIHNLRSAGIEVREKEIRRAWWEA